VDPQQGGDLALGAVAEVIEPQALVLPASEALGHRLPHRAHSLLDEAIPKPPPFLLLAVVHGDGCAHDGVQEEGVEGDLLEAMVEPGHVM